ncbi:MAG: plasmid replication initiator TrfA [Candidatus Competibacter sp.]
MKAIEARAIERSRRQRERAAQESLPLSPEALPPQPPPAKVVMLPIWPDAVRAVPNGFLRSALFGAIRRGARRYMRREQIAALEGIEIYYTGERLDQGDLDVWEMILHIARLQGLGNECRVTAYQLLKALGKTDSGKNREILDIRLSRMKATGIDVHIGRFGYEGSLIDEVYRDKETREYVFRVNAKLRTLFEPDQFTQVDWAVRRELGGQPLAQWLHGFYASHAKPYPISAAKLRELCGSEAESLRHFRQDLRKALDILEKANIKYNQSFSYKIQDDVIHADKAPSKTQRRHLENRERKSLKYK